MKTAYAEKESIVKAFLAEQGINSFKNEMFIRIFKEEQILEVWLRPEGQKKYIHVRDYTICLSSGLPGPKRKQGDYQTPEGFYYIDRFNPYSSFYLSLGINYPNQSDRIVGKSNLGGDIFIHGNCVTIGCIPLTDDKIKEVYLLAVESKSSGQQKIPVHIFPCRMSTEVYGQLLEKYPQNKPFWENLKTGYLKFEKDQIPPNVNVDSSGNYLYL